jgi:hypothetical protein
MLKIFVFLPCFNKRFVAFHFNNDMGNPIVKTKVNLNHYEVKLSLKYRLKSQVQNG